MSPRGGKSFHHVIRPFTMEDHVVVLGHGHLTRPILDRLGEETEYVELVDDEDIAERLRRKGYDARYVDAYTADELRDAGVEDAVAVVVASEDDADDAMAVLTATELTDARVVAVASNTENEAKLRRAGADVVFSPSDVVGRLLVESALTGEDTEAIVDRIQEAVT